MDEAEKQKRIEELEGEIMLAAFHGYRVPHYEKELLKLLEDQTNG
jgi:hypothetical protein